jgi:hypothetical protein
VAKGETPQATAVAAPQAPRTLAPGRYAKMQARIADIGIVLLPGRRRLEALDYDVG